MLFENKSVCVTPNIILPAINGTCIIDWKILVQMRPIR